MPIAVRMSAERVRHVSMMMIVGVMVMTIMMVVAVQVPLMMVGVVVMTIMMVMAMQVPLGRNGTCISMCATHGGTAGGGECKFPFEYKGETERLASW